MLERTHGITTFGDRKHAPPYPHILDEHHAKLYGCIRANMKHEHFNHQQRPRHG